jgi:hypothetical protein
LGISDSSSERTTQRSFRCCNKDAESDEHHSKKETKNPYRNLNKMADVTVEFGATDTGLEKTLKAVQGELNSLKDKVKGGELSMTELEGTMKRIGQVTSMQKNIKAIGDQSEEAGEKAKKAAGIFDEEFKRMGAAFTVGNLAAQGFQKAISLAFDAARAVVQGFSDALNLGGRLSELSTRTGETAGKLLVLETAFKNSGLEASAVGQVINKLQNFMQDATNGGEKQTKVMRDLGISFADLAGKTPSNQMQVFAEKIAAISDPTQRAATASEVFGEKLGGKLLPLLVDFSGNIDDARDKVGSLEQVMNENAATFDKFSESIETVKGKMTAFAAGILSETVPSLQELGSEMEGVDAAGLGEIIGQILNPAITDLTKNITLATDIFGTLKKAASDAGSGLKGQSDQFKEGATEANKYLQVIAALLPSGLDPLGLGLKAVANVAGEATDKMNGVATAADDAKPALAALGNEAVDTGDKIAKSFTLTSDLNTDITSIGASWSNVTDEITTSNSLLEGTEDAFTALNKETDQQIFGLGNINDQVIEGEKLRKKLLEITERITNKDAEAAEKTAQKTADQEKANALKQVELKFQLDIAEAQADGDTDRIEALKAEKKYAEDLQKAIDAGLDPVQAEKFANNMLKAASGISTTAREADRIQKSLATKIGADIKSKQDSEAVDPGGRLMKKAQDEIAAGRYGAAEATARTIKTREQDAMIRGTGEGKDRRAIQDIARDYGLRGSDKDIREELYKIRTEGQGTSDKVKKGIESTKNALGKDMKKEAEKKVEEKKTPMTLEAMVKIIQEAVVKLETKLPQPVMV